MATDSRKRTLEALERRIHTEHILKEKKKRINEDRKSPILAPSTSKVSSLYLCHSSPDTLNKGIFSLFGRSILQDVEDASEYAQLSVTLNENLLTTNGEFSAKRGGSVHGILHELLQKGDAAVKYMQGSRNMKIDNWILLDNYVQIRPLSSSSQSQALRSHSKRSKKHMSMKQHKKHGSFDLPRDFRKFDIFKPMHVMWNNYIALLRKSTGRNQLAQCLLGADLHGAIILVVDGKLTHLELVAS